MSFTLQELVAISGGELRGGDPAQQIVGAASLSEAVPGEVTFYADPRYLPRVHNTRASAIFVPLDFSGQTAAAQIRAHSCAERRNRLRRLPSRPYVLPRQEVFISG